MNFTNLSTAWLCLGVACVGVLAACAEGEPINPDFKAVAKGHAGSLAAGGSSMESAGTDVTSNAGSGGAGGSSDSNPTNDAGTTSSDSGMAGGGAVFDGPPSTGIRVEYQSQQSNNIAISIKLTNDGTDMPPLSSLKVRYFMVDEIGLEPAAVKFYFAGWNSGTNAQPSYKELTSTCTATVAKLMPAKSMADSYLEMGTSDGQLLSPKDTVEFQIGLQGVQEDPTNDYSYQTGTALAVNPHVVVLQGGNAIAGTPP